MGCQMFKVAQYKGAGGRRQGTGAGTDKERAGWQDREEFYFC